MDALALTFLGNRQHGRERPFDLGAPGISLFIGHTQVSPAVLCSCYGPPLYVFDRFQSTAGFRERALLLTQRHRERREVEIRNTEFRRPQRNRFHIPRGRQESENGLKTKDDLIN